MCLVRAVQLVRDRPISLTRIRLGPTLIRLFRRLSVHLHRHQADCRALTRLNDRRGRIRDINNFTLNLDYRPGRLGCFGGAVVKRRCSRL